MMIYRHDMLAMIIIDQDSKSPVAIYRVLQVICGTVDGISNFY